MADQPNLRDRLAVRRIVIGNITYTCPDRRVESDWRWWRVFPPGCDAEHRASWKPDARSPRGTGAVEVQLVAKEGDLDLRPAEDRCLFVPEWARVEFPLVVDPN